MQASKPEMSSGRAPLDLMQQDQSSAPLRRVQPTRRRWPWPLDLYQSAVGKKWAMAVSG